MARIKSANTKPELRLRSALWRAGRRFRVDYRALPGRPDIVFTRQRTAVFVDGEFWHGKKLAPERLAEMSAYWRNKIARNVERDACNNKRLASAGWRVVRVGARSVQKDLDAVTHAIARLLDGDPVHELPEGMECFFPESDGQHSSPSETRRQGGRFIDE